ncbi:hypothetical protein TsFJ059_003582 [Trichoderma semiorbis]|uniref:Zn(2)-C6 fungal-type domain-containing protein n=1 Tax=Trichoderma semiorbis TaxID=1491008 RepID=A0A9P8HRS7_9HYPO|nr:hypothetical protein TsFJ059_003582 [Trichoderma semiorbis]
MKSRSWPAPSSENVIVDPNAPNSAKWGPLQVRKPQSGGAFMFVFTHFNTNAHGLHGDLTPRHRATMDHEAIDRVLRQRVMSRGKACYPCRQRKVKCDHQQPCQTCQKRGHPEICTYDLRGDPTMSRKDVQPIRPRRRVSNTSDAYLRDVPHESRTTSSGRNLGRSQSTPRVFDQSAADGVSESTRTHEHSASFVTTNAAVTKKTYEGGSSIMGVLQQYAHDAAPELLRESGISFGLQNTLDGDPFTEATTPENRHASLLSLAPHTDEIQRFIPLYRHTIHPFMPLLVDIDEFELHVCEYLESRAAGDLRDGSKTLNQWFTGKGINTIAVILATLSCSSYFSDISITERSTTALKFVARAFQALRLANYMLRPSVEAVQTLLLLGNTLQNTGQSDGSWILLGTTIRLAQALGLHAANTKTRGANSRKKEALWSVIVWQDCFLSVCHGRPSGISKAQLKRLNFAAVTGPSLSYFEIMCRVGCLCVDLTEDVPTLKRSVDLVEAIDRCYSNALPHLQSLDECRNLHQRLEFFALQINMSFTIAVVCRPAMKKLPPGSGEDHYHQFLTARAKQSLFTTLRTFLAFQALSSMPLRNWSMLHSTLTSMLLLSVWEETRHDPQSRDLQERLVGLLLAVSEEGSSADTDSDGHPSYYTQWLSPRSIRTLIALQSAIRNTPPLTDHVSPTRSVETLLTTSEGASLHQTGLPVLDSQVPDQITALLGSSVAYDYDQFDWSTVDLSPFAFIDETVNMPFYDSSQM